MCDHTIALHLSESKPTVTRTTFNRLTSKYLCWSSCSRMDLVVNHVPQTLVICRSEEDLGNKLSTGVTIVHDFEASRLIAHASENVGDLSDCDLGKRRCIAFISSERC